MTAGLGALATENLLELFPYFLQYATDFTGTTRLRVVLLRITKVRRKRQFQVHPSFFKLYGDLRTMYKMFQLIQTA